MAEDENEQRINFIQRMAETDPRSLTIEHVTELQELRLRLEERMNRGEAWLNDYQRGMDGIALERNDPKFASAGALLVRLSTVIYPKCTSLLKRLMSMKLMPKGK